MDAEASDLQRTVADFVGRYGLEAPVQARLLDLASEVGELAKEALKATNYGQEPFEEPDGWRGELGDALFSLVCLANSTDVDLEAALQRTLNRYEERLRRAGSPASGGRGG